jgi:hypothetical protein
MANVARSSKAKVNKNILRFHRVKVYLQRYPGKFGADEERSIGSAVKYTVHIDGKFSQSGELEDDGSVEVFIPGGSIAELEALGTKYEIEPMTSLEPHDELLGIQRRLRLLGYFQNDVNEEWNAGFDRAVLNFQADHGLDPDGKGDQSVVYDKIKSEFGE